jgi:hypothetical protein
MLRMFETWNVDLMEIINVKHDHSILDMNLKFVMENLG